MVITSYLTYSKWKLCHRLVPSYSTILHIYTVLYIVFLRLFWYLECDSREVLWSWQLPQGCQICPHTHYVNISFGVCRGWVWLRGGYRFWWCANQSLHPKRQSSPGRICSWGTFSWLVVCYHICIVVTSEGKIKWDPLNARALVRILVVHKLGY